MTATAIGGASPLKGIACMIGGSALLTLNDAVTKWLAADYPVGQILAIRGLFIFLPIAVFAWRAGGVKALRVRNYRGQGLRALFFIGSSFFFVVGLIYNPLANNVAIAFAGPLFITALAPVVLSEWVGWRRWLAVLVGFLGVVLLVRPTGEALNWYALLPLGAAACGALRDLVTRHISVTESSSSILCCSTFAIVLAGTSTAPFGWMPLKWVDFGLLAATGLLIGCAHYLLIECFRLAEAAMVAPFKYTAVIWAVIFGYLLWGDLPDRWIVAGSILVIGSGLYILYREIRVRRTLR